MEFYSETNRPKTISQPECPMFEDEYQLYIDKDGKEKLKKTGVVNNYEKIQEAGIGIELHDLIKKYQINIDDYNWQDIKLEKNILDLENMPDDPIDCLNIINESKEIFDGLPVEIKQELGNNYTEFLKAVNDGSFKKLYESKIKPINEEKVEEQPNVQQTQENVNNDQNNGGINL